MFSQVRKISYSDQSKVISPSSETKSNNPVFGIELSTINPLPEATTPYSSASLQGINSPLSSSSLTSSLKKTPCQIITTFICTCAEVGCLYLLFFQTHRDSHQWVNPEHDIENPKSASLIDVDTCILAIITGFLFKTIINQFSYNPVVHFIKKNEYKTVPAEFTILIGGMLNEFFPFNVLQLYAFTWLSARTGSLVGDSFSAVMALCNQKANAATKKRIPTSPPTEQPKRNSLFSADAIHEVIQNLNKPLEGFNTIQNKKYLKWAMMAILAGTTVTIEWAAAPKIENKVNRLLTQSLLQAVWCILIGAIVGEAYGIKSENRHTEIANKFIYYFYTSLANPDQGGDRQTIGGLFSYVYHAIMLTGAGFALGHQFAYINKKTLARNHIIETQIEMLKKLASEHPLFFKQLRSKLLTFHRQLNENQKKPSKIVPKAIKYTTFGIGALQILIFIAGGDIMGSIGPIAGSLSYLTSYPLAKRYRPSPFLYNLSRNNVANYLFNLNLLPIVTMWCISNKSTWRYTSIDMKALSNPLLYAIKAMTFTSFSMVGGSYMVSILEGKLNDYIDKDLDNDLKEVASYLKGKYKQVFLEKDKIVRLHKLLEAGETSSIAFTIEEALFILANIEGVLAKNNTPKIKVDEDPDVEAGEREMNIKITKEDLKLDNMDDVITKVVKSTMLVSIVLSQIPMPTNYSL